MDPRFDNDAQTTGTLAGYRRGRDQPVGRGVQARAAGVAGGDAGGPRRARAATSRSSRTGASSSARSAGNGRGSAARWPPTSASTTRRSRAVMRWSPARRRGVRVLDDRSLNGIQVNGRRVEWSPLIDGDELVDRPPRPVLPGHRSSAPARPPSAALERVATSVSWRPDGRHDRGPVAQGRHGQDHDRPHPGRRAPARRAGGAGRRSRPAGQPVGLLRRPARRLAERRRRPRPATPRSRTRPTTGSSPSTLNLAEVERALSGKMGREVVLKKALKDARKTLRRDPDRLPAGARPADRQRARRRRLGADLLRGAVLRAAGRQRRARGDRAGPRVLQRRPRVPRRA